MPGEQLNDEKIDPVKADAVAAGATEAKPKKAARKPAKTAPQGAAPQKEMHIKSGPVLLFGKYSYDGIEVLDQSLRNYINLTPISYPHSFGRKSQNQFHKSNVNIIERLENSIMRGGTGGKVGGRVIRTKGRMQGKKIKAMKTIDEAFGIISRQTGKNPIQILVMALENSAPIEDTTRVRYGGIVSNVAVDISASRRLDVALRNIGMATVTSAFRNKRTIAQSMANELILASNNDVNSYAIKRKNETERMARSAK